VLDEKNWKLNIKKFQLFSLLVISIYLFTNTIANPEDTESMTQNHRSSKQSLTVS
jgi:hypothetical protein